MKLGDIRILPVNGRAGFSNLFYLSALCLGECFADGRGKVYDLRCYQDKILAKRFLTKTNTLLTDLPKFLRGIVACEYRKSCRVGWYILFNLCEAWRDHHLAVSLFKGFSDVLFSEYKLPVVNSLWLPQVGTDQSFFHIRSIIFFRSWESDGSLSQFKVLLGKSELRYFLKRVNDLLNA
jgi:hypothetical protein